MSLTAEGVNVDSDGGRRVVLEPAAPGIGRDIRELINDGHVIVIEWMARAGDHLVGRRACGAFQIAGGDPGGDRMALSGQCRCCDRPGTSRSTHTCRAACKLSWHSSGRTGLCFRLGLSRW